MTVRVRMRYDLLALGVAMGIGLSGLAGCQTARGVANRAVSWVPGFHSGSRSSKDLAAQKSLKTRGLELTLRMEPFPVSLGETRRIEVSLRLTNVSKRFVQLEFPTTQRFELLLRDVAGNTLVQWSEDQLFESTPSIVGINPGEHVEYRASLATRDLHSGGHYTVTAFFPSREDLKVELPLVPGK
ncbi:MAG: BsuPI-related putative proteinase inhibitor [Chthoniobacteraceae bacterium]|nr:BsuPI-related putative proteinase inhibitor [Chthoniobacteraceae bacterium]